MVPSEFPNSHGGKIELKITKYQKREEGLLMERQIYSQLIDWKEKKTGNHLF